MSGISNNEIKWVKSLSQKKYRDSLGLFTVEGEKMVSEAMESRFEVVRIFRMEDIGRDAMERISAFDSPSPVLAVLKKDSGPAEPDIRGGLYLALDSIRDPGNLGTILRIADWFGIDGVFASTDTVDLYNPKVVQSTMGAIFRVPFHVCDVPHLCRRFWEAGLPVFGTLLDGDDIYSAELSRNGLIVMGNESNGISPSVRELLTDGLLIPSYASGTAHAESLNVAVATAVAVAEFKRRFK